MEKIEVKITDTDFLSDEKLPWATPISSEVSEVKGKDIHASNRQSSFMFNYSTDEDHPDRSISLEHATVSGKSPGENFVKHLWRKRNVYGTRRATSHGRVKSTLLRRRSFVYFSTTCPNQKRTIDKTQKLVGEETPEVGEQHVWANNTYERQKSINRKWTIDKTQKLVGEETPEVRAYNTYER